jgi:hypothetical protein
MPPALFGTVVVHHPNIPASVLGLGMGVFTLVSALALFSRQ